MPMWWQETQYRVCPVWKHMHRWAVDGQGETLRDMILWQTVSGVMQE